MSTRIAYITDSHIDETFPKEQGVDARKNWMTILNDISTKGIDQIIFGGDIGEKSAYRWFFESLQHYALDVTLGNHDSSKEVIKHCGFGVPKEVNELYKSKFCGNHKLIFLDSSSGSIGEEQFDWLKEELITPMRIILFIHHPILEVDAEVDKRFALERRNRIEVELRNIENEVTIFCGHYHFEDEKNSDNIRQYITPASSFQVEKTQNEIVVNNLTFGYRIIELNDKGINTRVVLFS